MSTHPKNQPLTEKCPSERSRGPEKNDFLKNLFSLLAVVSVFAVRSADESVDDRKSGFCGRQNLDLLFGQNPAAEFRVVDGGVLERVGHLAAVGCRVKNSS